MVRRSPERGAVVSIVGQLGPYDRLARNARSWAVNEGKGMTYQEDIPESLAIAAHSGTSFSPERRGASERTEYADWLASARAKMEAQAIKGNTSDMVEAEFSRYREGYRRRYLAYLSSSSRCVSTMIAGPSGFPARRMNKRADIAHKRLGELLEFREKALEAACRNLRPDLAPIMAGDSDAIQRLTAELATLEAMQARMKAVNAAHKAWKRDPETLAESGLSDADKARIVSYKPSYSWEPHPYAPFQLTNNGANIRRVEKRIEAISKTKALPVQEREGTAATVKDDPPANRIRIYFLGKPDAEVRDTLKRNGFRWSPTEGAWQAYRNNNAMLTARRIAGIPDVREVQA